MSDKKEKVYIGSAWDFNGKYGPFVSISFKGNRNEDKFKVVLLDKETGGIMDLSEGVNVTLQKVKEKKTPKSPDYAIAITEKE